MKPIPPFDSLKISHSKLTTCRNEIQEFLSGGDSRIIAQVIGATGAGKSFLRESLHDEYIAKNIECMKKDLYIKPVISIELPATAIYNWKSFYKLCLKHLEHPFPEFVTQDDGRIKVIEEIHRRRTELFLIDEAQHAAHVGSNQSLERQGEIFKSLFSATQAKLVMFGTYGLLPIHRVNGQFARRTRIIHFERYKSDEKDFEAFTRILYVLSEKLQSILAVKLDQHAETLYAGTAGLVGCLRNWLMRAYGLAQNGKITIELLKRTQDTVLDLMPILEEAKEGEAELSPSVKDIEHYAELLKA
jgi:hypothetical protein